MIGTQGRKRKAWRGRSFVDAPGLVRERKALGLTQKQLAVLSGVSNINIVRIEGGQRTTLQTLGKLAAALGVDPDALLSKEPLERDASRFEAGEGGAGEIEDQYIARYAMGGEHADPPYEAEIAEEYLRIFRNEGSTDEVFRLAVRRALGLGKDRGKALAERRDE